MKKHFATLFLSIILMLSVTSLSEVNAFPSLPNGYAPTYDKQTLLSSVAPENATLGQTLSWLIWTDPPLSEQQVTLTIKDRTNSTIISKSNENLSTLNECGSKVKTVNTNSYLGHRYEFIANITVGDMKIESHRYIDFMPSTAPKLSIYAFTTEYSPLVGDPINVTIHEGNYPFVNAVANMTVYNATNPSLYVLNNIALPSSNGSRMVTVPTSSGFVAGTYSLRVNATSSIGDDSYISTNAFELKDIFLTVLTYYLYIDQLANFTIRTYSTVSQAGLNVSYSYFNFTTFSLVTVKLVDQFVPLTFGMASISLATTGWPEEFLTINANATVGTKKVFDSGFFSLAAFDVFASTDKNNYVLPNTSVNLTIATTPIQVGAVYNISITDSGYIEVWRFGAANGTNILDAQGHASKSITTTDWLPDTYQVTVTVNNTKYQETDYDYFTLYMRTFNIYATLPSGYYDPGYSNYVMPVLNITTSPGQTNANLTLDMRYSSYYTYSHFKLVKTGFDASLYQYLLPLPEMQDGSRSIQITVKSSLGVNSTSISLYFTHNKDADGDGLPDSQEVTMGISPTNPDTDGDGFFDGMEVFHGSNALDQTSTPLTVVPVIPEFPNALLMLTLLAIASPIILLLKRRMEAKSQGMENANHRYGIEAAHDRS